MVNTLLMSIFHFFRSLGLIGAFLSMFIENLGIPLPTEFGYLISQDITNTHRHSYFLVLIILTLGHLAGALISYRVGFWGNGYVGRRIRKSHKIVEVRDRLEKWYAKYGNITVFLARFVGYVRPWSSYVAGFSKVKFWPFVIWTTIGSLIFNIIALYFSGLFLIAWRNYAVYHVIFITGMFFLFFALIIYEIFKFLASLRHRHQ